MLDILVEILGFILKKRFKWLEPARKLLTALIETFGGDTGKVVDICHDFANEIVKKIEGIDNESKIYAEKKLEIDYKFIAKNSDEFFPDFKITEKQYDDIARLQDLNFVIINSNDNEEIAIAKLKKYGVKYNLAFELCMNHIHENKLEYTVQALNLIIEFAVSRYFTKAIK